MSALRTEMTYATPPFTASTKSLPPLSGRHRVSPMAWATLRFTKDKVNEAGARLTRPLSTIPAGELIDAVDVVANWRSCHTFPLNTFQMTLRRKAHAIHETAIVAQRIKRLPAIIEKLRRLKHLKLAEFQDIAGCRSVLPSVAHVRQLRTLYQDSELRHVLQRENDYISTPKRSGYRGIHLIYEYQSDRTSEHNGRLVEIQLRSRLQHAWATAVETATMFSAERFKSSQGDKRWLRFFALMGSVISFRENAPLVPGTPQTRVELLDELKSTSAALEARNKLAAWGEAIEAVTPDKGWYFLLRLDAAAAQLKIQAFSRRQLREASNAYSELEKSLMGTDGIDAVLVSVDSVKKLRSAYPNYYFDTKIFLAELDLATGFQVPKKS